MVYLLKVLIFHGKLLNNQRVYTIAMIARASDEFMPVVRLSVC